MKSKILSFLLVTSVLFLSNGYVSGNPAPQDNRVEIERLTGLCRLWGYVKYSHPSLAYRTDIDWDAALINTIPEVRNAKTSAEYSAALQGMLGILDDGMTRIVDPLPAANAETAPGDRTFKYSLTGDGVLVVTAGNYFALWDQAAQEKIKGAIGELAKAKAVVFDLRSVEEAGNYGQVQLSSVFGQFERLILSTPIITGGERRRVHHGFEGNSPFSSGQYKSGFYTRNVKRTTPAQNSRDVPAVFLLNKNAGLPDSIPVIQASGRGLVVFEGDAKDSFIGKTEKLDLGEGISARVRIAETILEDGRSGDTLIDKIVSAGANGTDAALETALGLAKDFKPSTAQRKKIPATAATPREKSYAEMKYPSIEYRLLAAFRIWTYIYYFFPYKNLMDRDWSDVLREFIPKFERANDALEYSLTAAEMMTHVHDSHAYVSGDVINKHFGTYYPPIRVRWIENSPLIDSVTDEKVAKAAGVESGDILVKVDGEDAKVRLARYAKYISASTPQSNMDKATLAFMNGPDASEVRLTVRGRNNKIKEVKLPRKFEDYTTLYHRERSGDIIKLISPDIGYADLDRLTSDMIDDMFERFKKTRAIIFDMRGYPNSVFWVLPQRLTEKSDIPAALLETPIVGDIFAPKSSNSFFQTVFPRDPAKSVYKGRTLMLIDERTMSQAEHTGLFLRAANGTKFVGSHTSGADGELTTFSLPGGIGVGFTGQSVRFPDGRQLQRIGLVPDVEVKPTIKGIRAGRDEVLDAAVKYLGRELKKR